MMSSDDSSAAGEADPDAPVPMTDEESAAADQARADGGAPYAMADEGDVEAPQEQADSGAPVPVEAAAAAQQRAQPSTSRIR
jgi:hypothetical protein